MEIDTYAREKLELADGLRVTVNNLALQCNAHDARFPGGRSYMEPTDRELAEDLDDQYRVAADAYQRALVSFHNALLLSRGMAV